MKLSFCITSAILARQTVAFPVHESQSLRSIQLVGRQDQLPNPPDGLPTDPVPDTIQVPGVTNTFVRTEDLVLPNDEKPDETFQKVDSDNPPLAAEGAKGENTIADSGSPQGELKKAELPPEIAKLTCTDAGVTNANDFDQDRWEALSTDKVLSLANAEWIAAKSRGSTRLGYTQFLSNYFNGPEGLICSEISNKPCAEIIQCDDTNHPAGYFILNSLATMHGLAMSMYTEMDHARGDLTSSISSFMSTFAPKAKPDVSLEIFKTILDTVLMAASMGSAFTWNKLVKTTPSFNSDSRGWAKDSFNAQMAFAFNVAKDNSKGAASTKAEQALELEDVANQYYIIMSDMIIEFNKAIFDGSGNGLKMLTAAFREGKFMPNNGVGLDTQSFKSEMNGAVWGKLMVQAWLKSPDTERHPLVLETDEPCDGKRSMTGKFFSDDTAKKTKGCIDGKAYYLLDAVPKKYCAAYEECSDDGTDWFRPLPGGDNENFNSGKWGPTKIDLIVSSVREGWKRNGDKNGFKDQLEPPKDGDLTAWFEGLSMGAPGFWTGIPFCSVKGWDDVVLDMNDGTQKRSPYFPCR